MVIAYPNRDLLMLDNNRKPYTNQGTKQSNHSITDTMLHLLTSKRKSCTGWPFSRHCQIPKQLKMIMMTTLSDNHIMLVLLVLMSKYHTIKKTMASKWQSKNQCHPQQDQMATFPCQNMTFPRQVSKSLTFPGFQHFQTSGHPAWNFNDIHAHR